IERVKESTKIAILWSLSGAVILSAIQIYFSTAIVEAFSESPVVIAKGVQAMFAGSIFFWTYGFQAIGVIFLLSIGKNKFGFLFSIARQGILFIPIIIMLNFGLGEIGIFYTQGITDLVTSILLIGFLYYNKKKELLY